MTVLDGALAGILIVIASFWASYLVARLWQQSLYDDAHVAIEAASAKGLPLRRPGLRSRLVCEGMLDGERVRIEWRGGVQGARTVLIRGRERTRVPLVVDGASLETLLTTRLQGTTSGMQEGRKAGTTL